MVHVVVKVVGEVQWRVRSRHHRVFKIYAGVFRVVGKGVPSLAILFAVPSFLPLASVAKVFVLLLAERRRADVGIVVIVAALVKIEWR